MTGFQSDPQLVPTVVLGLQVLELPNRNDKIVDFQWEPRGSRFAVLHGEGPRPNLSLYAMRDMKTSARGVQHITTQPGKQANCIHWSPQVRLSVSHPPPPAVRLSGHLLSHAHTRPHTAVAQSLACSIDGTRASS